MQFRVNTALCQGCRVGVSHLKETTTPGPLCLIWTFVCKFVAVYLTFVQFILQLNSVCTLRTFYIE